MPETLPPHLSTLGVAALHHHASAQDNTDLLLRPGKPLALLAYLHASPRRSASREQLVDLLWADAEPERGRQSLRQALTALRRVLGGEAIATLDERVSLELDLPSDRTTFLAAISAGDDLAALQAYGGRYLGELTFPGAQALEHWAALEAAYLERLFLQAAEGAARAALVRGGTRDALRIARRMRDVAPAREASWRLLFQSALALHDRGALTLETEAYQAQLAAEGRTSEPATQRLLDEARALLSRPRSALATAVASDTMTATLTAQSHGLVADLAGREREFGALLSAWESARAGHATTINLRGAAGMGKTRLLAEFRSRLRGVGGRMVLVRAHPADRDVPLALASDIARVLCTLPGARGVTPASAGVLLALAPSVGALFPGSTAHVRDGAGVSGAHVHALAELLSAVTTDAPVALGIDDLQWADDLSLALLGSLLGRMEDERMLVICASRQSLPATERAATIELSGLDEDRVRELVASIADADGVYGMPAFARDLTSSTGGSPLLVLETLQLMLDAGIVRILDERWDVLDPEGVRRALEKPGGALGRRLESLDEGARRAMVHLAVAGAPVAAPQLARACGMSDAEGAGALEELEWRGFVRRRGDAVEVSHDEFADAMLTSAGSTLVHEAHRALGRALLEQRVHAADGDGERGFRRALQHSAAGGDEQAVVRGAVEWLERATGDRRSDRARLGELLGPYATEGRVRAILRARPLGRRLLGGTHRRTAVGMAGGGLALAMIVGLAAWLTTPDHLSLVTQPLSVAPVMPAPIVELQNRLGKRVDRGGDSVRATLVGNGAGTLVGVTVAPVEGGRAAFTNLALRLPESEKAALKHYRLRFEVRGMAPAFSDTLLSDEVSSTGWSNLRLVRGTLAGQAIAPGGRHVVVHPGERLRGEIQLDYTTRWGSAAIMLGMSPTWGDRQHVFRELSALPTPMEHGLITVPVEVLAPPHTGHYALIFAFAAEARVDWIFSGTNWQAGTPTWGDGNDLMDWTSADWDAADRRGVVGSRVLHPGPAYRNAFVPATTVRVDVIAPAGAPSSVQAGR